jgi:DNA primase
LNRYGGLYEGCGEIDVVDALIELGLENVGDDEHGEIAFSCPFDGHVMGDRNPSNHMNSDKLVYNCKSCHRAGTLLDLVGRMIKGSPIEALHWLRERYGDVFRPLKGSAAREMEEFEQRWAQRSAVRERRLPREEETIGPRSIFAIDWRSDEPAAVYMREERGFSPETLERWGAGYDRWSRRVTIPIRDENGVLVGFKGRSIDPGAKVRYSLLGDRPGVDGLRYGEGYGWDMHETDSVVYAVDVAARAGRRGVAVEGELNAWAMHDAGVSNTFALGMSSVSENQLRIISWHFDEVVLFLDHDPAGIRAVWGAYDREADRHWDGLTTRLAGRCRVLVVPPHEGDPASMAPEERISLVESAEPWIQVATAA